MKKVALVHDFLTQYGGAERVLEAFHEIFPQAPVYTLVFDKEQVGERFAGWDIRTSFIQQLPGAIKNYKWYLPMMARAVERWDFSEYDLVLSDSSAFAKGIITETTHICYCHSPTRYLWVEMDQYVQDYPLATAIKWYLQTTLRPWDYEAAQRPDVMVANSKTVRERIKKYYERETKVIYPPVDTKFYKPSLETQDYYLTGGRLEPYKKIDLVVEAFKELRLPLKIVGAGTQETSIKYLIANLKNIEFLGKVSDKKLRDLYSGARAFVFPALEDAGIAVLESLSCGTPVIGLAKGGTAELVADQVNGVLFEDQTLRGVVSAVNRFQKIELEDVRNSALKYDKEVFKVKILEACGLT